MFVELDTRQTDGLTVSLEWDRETGDTQVVVYDSRTAIEVSVNISMFLSTTKGVVLVDEPLTIGHTLLRAIDDVTRATAGGAR